MNFNPLLPWPLLVGIGLALVAWVVYCAVRSDSRTRQVWFGRGVMVLALILALARPGVGAVSAEVADESVDVLFVVDASASSAAEDWAGSQPRYEGMAEDIRNLAMQHPGARYSLVSFASYSVQRLPFTTDASALQNSLNTLQPEPAWVAEGSSVGAAAELVEEVLEGARDDYPDRVRVVYYLGDGEHTAQTEIESFSGSSDLIQGGAVFGYGTEQGGRMIEWDRYGPTDDYILDRAGNPGVSQLEEENLVTIADELNLPYEHRTAAEPVTAAAVDPGRGQSLDGTSTQVTTFPLYWVFALLVLAWLLFEGWLLGRATNEIRVAREDLE